MSYYEILGVKHTSSDDEIKKAFRKMSIEKHPDKNPNSKDEYLKINEAYDTLKDKDRRRIYDFNNIGDNVVGYENNGVNMELNNFFSEILSSAIDSGVKKGKGKQINDFAAIFGMPGKDENIPFDPGIFMNPSMSFNGGKLFDESPDDIVIEQLVTYQQSYNGCCIPIHLEREIVKGHMRKTESETIYMNIERGVDKNEMIDISQKGNIKDGIASNVKVKIILEEHREYSRRGIDLILHKSISYKDSLCGFEFNLEHINGKSIKFTSSRGNVVQNGDEKIINNLGFHRGELVGNLILCFHVVQPNNLTEEQLKLIEDVF